MALKFLNKKGWHTGSLRNIENVWKAEQKHDAEQKKLEELRKQIHEERERSEFRQLQEQAGLVPKQERLEFLYDSGLAVGKASASDGFKALEAFPKSDDGPSSSLSKQAAASSSAVPGALFEDKPQSANDAWRKLHSDPLLMIRQREQEALARIKNNPVQMAMIRKSVEGKPKKKKSHDEKEHGKKHHHSNSKHQKHSSSSKSEEEKRKSSHRKSSNYDKYSDSEDESRRKASRGENNGYRSSKYKERSPDGQSDSEDESRRKASRSEKNGYQSSKYKEQSPDGQSDQENAKDRRNAFKGNHDKSEKERYLTEDRHESRYKRRNAAPKISEEERAARLREMQMDAELHEEQRWKRLKKAEDDDAREATQAAVSRGKNFLDAAQKSVYGTEMGGSKSIAESVRRRTHYSQGRSEDGHAFRR
ncbi:Pre-mRNA splicing factor [Trema orientale]|uniref:Pre-mRNA splicing factor n=1 Tax=Trema orientale TaxID=63057 RepID=A0A2P5DY90_TREOI|nr:Pre-mRNA splicing factor [Trema orientale]